MRRNPAVLSLGSALLVFCLSGFARADGPALTSLEQLKHLEACELDRLYAEAEPGPLPVGDMRGRVLLAANTRHPRAQARFASLLWKGKHFDDDGTFINQFVGFRALTSQAADGPSWFDGKPAHILEYPPGTPVFGNVRDEIRQIGPGLYLGRIYERDGCRRFQGYFALQVKCCACAK